MKLSNRTLDYILFVSSLIMVAFVVILLVVVVVSPRPHKIDNRPICGWNYKTVSVKPILKKWVPVRCDLAVKNLTK